MASYNQSMISDLICKTLTRRTRSNALYVSSHGLSVSCLSIEISFGIYRVVILKLSFWRYFLMWNGKNILFAPDINDSGAALFLCSCQLFYVILSGCFGCSVNPVLFVHQKWTFYNLQRDTKITVNLCWTELNGKKFWLFIIKLCIQVQCLCRTFQ